MAKDNFQSCLAFVLKYEGGYVFHPKDPGGPTNMGITQATLSLYLGRRATITDVQTMTRDTAGTIYKRKYWNTIKGDDLPRGVDLLAFDIAVNSGPGRANDWLLQSSQLKIEEQIEWLDRRRRSFWKSLRTWAVFGKGWTRREDACLALAKAMARTT